MTNFKKLLSVIFMRLAFVLFFLLPSLSSFSQETHDYWFAGYVYTDSTDLSSGVPYQLVALSREGEQTPMAVTVTNSLGAYGFTSSAIDVTKQYTIALLDGKTEKAVYRCQRFDKKPASQGFIGTHLAYIPSPNFYTQTTSIPTKGDGALMLLDFLKQKIGLEWTDHSLFSKGSDTPYFILLNDNPVPQDDIEQVLEQLPVEYVKHINVISYNTPNDYYSGVINIRLTIGDEPVVDKGTILRNSKRVK